MLDSLHICGFGWQGINDMHKEAWKMAKRILSGVQDGGGAEIKGGVFLMLLSFAKIANDISKAEKLCCDSWHGSFAY